MSDPIFRIVDGVRVEVPEAEADALRAEWAASPSASVPLLNRAQWSYFLDVTGFRATLTAVLDAMPRATAAENKAWARLKSVALDSPTYSQANTLAILANMRAGGVSGLPSDQDIIDAWADAALENGAADLIGG